MTQGRPISAAAKPSDPLASLLRALDRLDATEPRVRAWESIDREDAFRQAEHLARQGPRGRPLYGRVLGVKDVIDVSGFPTRAGSRALADATPAQADATVVARLRRAGCIVLGKLKTTEFAYIDPTDTTNPLNSQHTPGGSSSGSGAAVACGSAELALGTQTVGSVCRPAAYCGTAAFKPSTRSTAATGVTPLARSFDTVGFFAADIALAAQAWQVASGDTEADPPSDDPDPLARIRIGVLDDPFYAALEPSARAALERATSVLAARGIMPRHLQTGCDFEGLREDQRIMMMREAALVHSGLLSEAERLGPNWRAALERGRAIDDSAYWSARDRLAERRAGLGNALRDVDILLVPPVRGPAPAGLGSTGDAGLIVPWTVFGGPLAVLPVGASPAGLPTAVMIVGKPATDAATARIATAIEAALRLDPALPPSQEPSA